LSKQYFITGTPSDRYYVSVGEKNEPQLTTLGSMGEPISYSLPEFPPGLTAQLNEWRRWRDMLDQAMRITDNDGIRAAYADALGAALTFPAKSEDS
jgi:hypothetical protein